MDTKRAARRRFLKQGVALAGVAVGARSASGQTLGSAGPETLATHPMAYGERSHFFNAVRTPMTMIGHMDLHGRPNGLDAWTPLGALTGSITPSALHYVSSHGNDPPDIDRREHRLLINGMVERPLVFTMDELMRLPVVSRIHYIECVANAAYPNGKTLEQMHGMIGCSEWTGVPLSLLLNEVGVRSGANWILAEGAEATKIGTSLPMGKAMDDVLVAYGQNGEPLRPHQGYPLRLLVPGLKRPRFSWTRIKGESNVQGGGGNGSVEGRGTGRGIGADGGSPEGDGSPCRRGGGRGGLPGAGAAVERQPEARRGAAAAAWRIAGGAVP